MAAPPPPYTYKSKAYPPSEYPHNPALNRQQCPRCANNRPNTNNVDWPPPYSLTNPAPARVGFKPPNYPTYPTPVRPTYQHHPPPPPPTTCAFCACADQQYRSYPVPPPPDRTPSRGGVKSYYWVDTFSHGGVPTTALHGGHDIDGAQIYVGRAFHEGDWIPAKVIPERNVAYVAYGGAEHAKDQYQVLCEQRFDWVPSSGGHVPPGAVEGGKTSDGESLYIGRVHHDGAITVGKVHPSHSTCYIPFDGREVGHHSYEILVLRN